MTEANAPAYPVEVQNDGNGKMIGLQTSEVSGFVTGLTKREYFAGLAMQGLLSGQLIMEVISYSPEELAKTALQYTDALISELSKPQP